MDTATRERFEEIDARLDRELASLKERVTELVVSERLMADDVARMRTRLQEKMDVLEGFVGQTIDHLQEHAADPEAHQQD